MKKINNKLINDWLRANSPEGRSLLSIASRCSPSMVDKLASNNYDHMPKKIYREKIAETIGAKEEDVFPGIK